MTTNANGVSNTSGGEKRAGGAGWVGVAVAGLAVFLGGVMAI
jgi:hypothetical protein